PGATAPTTWSAGGSRPFARASWRRPKRRSWRRWPTTPAARGRRWGCACCASARAATRRRPATPPWPSAAGARPTAACWRRSLPTCGGREEPQRHREHREEKKREKGRRNNRRGTRDESWPNRSVLYFLASLCPLCLCGERRRGGAVRLGAEGG